MKKIIAKVKEKKELIIKCALMLLMLVGISLLTMLILFLTGVLDYVEGGFVFDSHMFESFSGKWYGFIVFILVQVVLSSLLCAIPGMAMGLVLLSSVIYPDPVKAFFLSFFSVMLTSASLYITGRLGGHMLCEKMLGKEDCEKSLTLLRDRGTVYFPIMMLFPIFPDDALVMIAGTTKMKLSWFIPSIIIGRGIGIATVLLTVNIIPFDRFTSLYDWLVFITFCFFWIREVFKVANRLDRHFEKRRKEERAEAEQNSVSTAEVV